MSSFIHCPSVFFVSSPPFLLLSFSILFVFISFPICLLIFVILLTFSFSPVCLFIPPFVLLFIPHHYPLSFLFASSPPFSTLISPVSLNPSLFLLPSFIFSSTPVSSVFPFALLHLPLPFLHCFNMSNPPGMSREEMDEVSSCLFSLSVYLPFSMFQVSLKLNSNTSPKTFISLPKAFIYSDF